MHLAQVEEGMSNRMRVLRAVRLTHLYLGVFIAPALIFFAITGGLQTFSLHETTRGSSYRPPAILVRLGQLHKKQTLVVPDLKSQPGTLQNPVDKTAPAPAPVHTNSKPEVMPASRAKNLPMKIFFALVSVGLLASTVTGLYMAYKYTRSARVITVLWIAGIAIPVILTLL